MYIIFLIVGIWGPVGREGSDEIQADSRWQEGQQEGQPLTREELEEQKRKKLW